MPEGMEDNQYKAALSVAMGDIQRQRNRFVGSPSTPITRAVSTNRGWDCEAGDDWSEQCQHELTGVLAAFDDAYDAMERKHDDEPDEVSAEDPDEWRGSSYVQTNRRAPYGLMRPV